MSNQEDPKPDGAAFDDFFESLGKKAENLTIDEQNGNQQTAVANGAATAEVAGDDEQKVVDEIESLCMNCHKNVRVLTPFLREKSS